MTDINYNNLKKNYLKYLESLNSVGDDFGGPSMYFHNRALEERNKRFLGEVHIEMIYATLTSWGMHRMGSTHTKMVTYEVFRNSILRQIDKINLLKDYKIEDITVDLDKTIKRLNDICFSLQVSTSKSKIVGNSKTLAHILPNLVPPIDRQYTILFFQIDRLNLLSKTGKLKQPNFKVEDEQMYFDHIINKTFDFINYIKADKRIQINTTFNTSYPKIFDNFIMTYLKTERKSHYK